MPGFSRERVALLREDSQNARASYSDERNVTTSEGWSAVEASKDLLVSVWEVVAYHATPTIIEKIAHIVLQRELLVNTFYFPSP